MAEAQAAETMELNEVSLGIFDKEYIRFQPENTHKIQQ